MMSIPFFLIAAALVAAWSGYRRVSVALWATSLFAVLVLFLFHATDTLGIAL
jgi:hypothetical protein